MTQKKCPTPQTIALLHPEADTRTRCPMSGSKSEVFANRLSNQIAAALGIQSLEMPHQEQQMHAALGAVMGVAPRDEVEGMLAAQMVATHHAVMECYRRLAIPEQTFAGREMAMNYAGKLARTYAAQMEALNRYRGKGQQKMTVEHVHVHAGGQAIVGQVSQHKGGGVITKNEEPPHAP